MPAKMSFGDRRATLFCELPSWDSVVADTRVIVTTPIDASERQMTQNTRNAPETLTPVDANERQHGPPEPKVPR